MYHRVMDAATDPWSLCVTPQHFAEQMALLRQRYTVMSLNMMSRGLNGGRLPRRAVVVTFDDGYADNFWNAKPVLESYEMPATFFIATGYLGKNREFWWDELEKLILLTPSLPHFLELTLKGRSFEWYLGESARRPVADEPGCSRWKVGETNPTLRHQAYEELHRLLLPLRHEERETALASIRSQAKSICRVRPNDRVLTSKELLDLAANDLLEIGSHTVTHPVLSRLSREEQLWEIEESKRALELLLGQKVTAFCYPFGGASDVGEAAIGLAQEVGFKVCCSTVPRAVTRSANPFWLPRFFVGDWDGDRFSQFLNSCFQ